MTNYTRKTTVAAPGDIAECHRKDAGGRVLGSLWTAQMGSEHQRVCSHGCFSNLSLSFSCGVFSNSLESTGKELRDHGQRGGGTGKHFSDKFLFFT